MTEFITAFNSLTFLLIIFLVVFICGCKLKNKRKKRAVNESETVFSSPIVDMDKHQNEMILPIRLQENQSQNVVQLSPEPIPIVHSKQFLKFYY